MSWLSIGLWPAIGLGLAMFALAFSRQPSTLGFLGVAGFLPLIYYLGQGGLHAEGLFAAAFLVLLGATAVLLRRGRRRWALACFAPVFIWTAWLAVAVAFQ